MVNLCLSKAWLCQFPGNYLPLRSAGRMVTYVFGYFGSSGLFTVSLHRIPVIYAIVTSAFRYLRYA